MSASTDQINYANQQILVAALVKGRRFPHVAKSVRLIETHISWVLLAGCYAYKIKKALDLGFLNFTNLETRRFCCSEEIRLNSRLAPKSYIDVIAIGGNFESPEFGLQPAIEYAVRMRRFSSAKELDRLLTRGKVDPLHMDRLADMLAAFHGKLPCAKAGSGFGTPETIHAETVQNFEQLFSIFISPADKAVVTSLTTAIESEFIACEKYFEQRVASGFVRECHGDLHLGNIVLIGKQPVPFDGIEFDPVLRWIDVIDEVAFLVMDLMYGLRYDLAYRFLNAYLELTGDFGGISVLRFYISYRAAVRAKVMAIRAFQADLRLGDQTRALTSSHNYLKLAGECLAVRHPALVITHGLPGSGKSSFAQAALERLHTIRIRSDVERKRLFGMNPPDNSHMCAGTDIYSADATRRTYTRLYELTHAVLGAGFPVIVDAAFLKLDEREKFHALALSLSVPFAIVSLKASDATLIARIKSRNDAENDASEADPEVLEKLKVAQQPLLPHELAHTVEFLNDADKYSNPDTEGCWDRLDVLINL